MPYITDRFKEARYDELRDILQRLDRVQAREKLQRKELAETLHGRRELEALVAKVQKEILTGKPDEQELPMMKAIHRNGEQAAGDGHAPEREKEARNGHAPARGRQKASAR